MRPEWVIEGSVERSLRDARGPLPGETDEDWVTLGTKPHGGFGSYVALGVYIGLDAREQLGAKPRQLEVSFANAANAPCPCLADGLQLATGATVGRGSLTMASEPAPTGAFGVVTVTDPTSRRTLRYTIPDEAREMLDNWNKLPAHERLPALRTVPADELFQRVEITP
jgi:formylmethanofuran dehydrogenase subunit E